MKLEIVTTEETVFSDDVDIVIAPGAEGQLGILPRHASLLTALNSGNIVVRKDGQESVITVNGGFLEVAGDHVRILANSNQ
ncbi:MAG: ATP synthase F1 subunit epsilon [Chloroflexota bacterium]|nr:ATP synthase F1 subunit epsilon [Chloroflexota bacterium]